MTENAKEERARLVKAFGARVKTLRLAAGLRQEDLAEAVGMDRVAISQIERGLRDVGASRLPSLATALGVAPSDLFATEPGD